MEIPIGRAICNNDTAAQHKLFQCVITKKKKSVYLKNASISLNVQHTDIIIRQIVFQIFFNNDFFSKIVSISMSHLQ